MSAEETQLREQILFLRLTKMGITALREWVPEGGAFSALVVSEKSYGIWVVAQEIGTKTISQRDDEVVLIRWDYLASAMFMRRRFEDQKAVKARPSRWPTK
jgi:hypothetical protein